MSQALFATLSAGALILSHSTVEEFRTELNIQVVKEALPSDKTCQLILVHHGSTEWSEIGRLQGWQNIPLSEKGKNQIEKLAERLHSVAISAIYSSSLQSAMETSVMLQENHECPLYPMAELRGECHGTFDGYTKQEYVNHPHFQYYDSLAPEEEIFFPCGKEGESKADVARRVIPALKKIASEHIGEKVIVVTHGGVFKFLNFYLGNYKESGTISIPYGEMMIIQGDAQTLYIKP